MITTQSNYKIPGGKLIRLTTKWNPTSKIIESVQISGDFFLHPETAIVEIEATLQGISIDRDTIINKIDSLFEQMGIKAYGISASQIADAIIQGVRKANNNPISKE